MKRKVFFLVILFISFVFSVSYSEGLKIKEEVLKNGLTVIVKENLSSDIIAVKIFIKTGPIYEDDEKTGITNFVQNLLLKGTKSRDKDRIAEELESLGIILNTSVAPDYAEVSLVTQTMTFKKGLEILIDILFNSTFLEKEVEKERKIILQEIKSSNDELFSFSYNILRENLYKKHPYHRPEIGYKETIEKLKREDLINFYNTYYQPNNIILSVCGDFDIDEMLFLIKKSFSNFKSKKLPQHDLPKFGKLEPGEFLHRKDIRAGWIFIGFPAPSINESSYAVLKLIDCVLGSGMSSRLFVSLRERLGLAYEVNSFYPSRKGDSHFVAYIITRPSNIDKAKSGIIWEIAKLKQILVTEDELTRAKKYLIGNFILDHEKNEQQAFYLGFYELLGLGYQFDVEYPKRINETTSDDIRKVARRYFNDYIVAGVVPETTKSD